MREWRKAMEVFYDRHEKERSYWQANAKSTNATWVDAYRTQSDKVMSAIQKNTDAMTELRIMIQLMKDK